ncbi:hypothetical protein DP117_08330 [Brasilonema sp. UFV-L1]|nr:hypothetical protein [Brasilonema sp. UFV-L1]
MESYHQFQFIRFHWNIRDNDIFVNKHYCLDFGFDSQDFRSQAEAWERDMRGQTVCQFANTVDTFKESFLLIAGSVKGNGY